nr:hypothetical protein [Pseudoduganella guangdongensis]
MDAPDDIVMALLALAVNVPGVDAFHVARPGGLQGAAQQFARHLRESEQLFEIDIAASGHAPV